MKADLRVFNAVGGMIKQFPKLSDMQEILMADVAAGVYMFQLLKDGEVKMEKVVKR
jgi:hypothetical protein